MSLSGLEEGRKMSFYIEIGLFLNLCSGLYAVLVLKSSQDGISTLSQNSEKTRNFLLINLQNKHYINWFRLGLICNFTNIQSKQLRYKVF